MFALKTSRDQIVDPNGGITKYAYRKVVPKSNSTGDAFGGNEIRFDYTLAGVQWWVPSRSYVQVRATITKEGIAVVDGDGIAPAYNFTANLFDAVDLQVAGMSIESITKFLPQIDAMKKNIRKGKTYFEGVGKESNFLGTFDEREATVLARNKFETIWQPPLGAFDYNKALPSGKYELILRPSNDYKLRGMETSGANPIVIGIDLGQYDLEITDINFYVCIVEGPRANDSLEYVLDFDSMDCHSQEIAAGETADKQFTISKTTHGLAIAVQSKKTADPRHPLSLFRVSADGAATETTDNYNEEATLTRLRVDYAGQSFPQPEWAGVYDATTDRLTQRYIESQLFNDAHDDDAGALTKSDWLTKGMYAYFRVGKDGSDASTNCAVSVNYTTLTSGANLLVFDMFRKVAIITIANGQVVNVRSEDA